MEIRYNVTGARRKELVKIISDITEARAEYQYMPTCNYKIGYFTVTRDGTLCFDNYTNRVENERVLEAVAAAGFECEPQGPVEAPAVGEMEASERNTKETVKADPIMEDMGLQIPEPLRTLHNRVRPLDLQLRYRWTRWPLAILPDCWMPREA